MNTVLLVALCRFLTLQWKLILFGLFGSDKYLRMKKELKDKEQRAKLSGVGYNSPDKKGEEDNGKGKNVSADVAIASTVMPKEDIGTLTISEYRGFSS